MHIRPISFTLLLCFLAAPCLLRAAEPNPTEAASAMVEAERKFYRTGQEKGTRAAFLDFLADDSVVFRPGPVNGKESWGKRPETGLDLAWEPTFAAIARSADFGYTTGPAKWRTTKQEELFSNFGHFVSVWKKQKDGSWKVAIDCGIENPPPSAKQETLRIFVPENTQPARTASARKAPSLPEAHQEFVEAAKTNSANAILGVASEGIRVYREGSFPAVGRDAAAGLLSKKGGKTSFEQMGGGMSSSADLAYNYGKYIVGGDGSTESGHFLQIWQTDPAGYWKLVLDWQQPLPARK